MELTACWHPVHDEQTNFQNITEISFLPSSFWYFVVTANCLLLGAHVLIVTGTLQIYIDDDDEGQRIVLHGKTFVDVDPLLKNGYRTPDGRISMMSWVLCFRLWTRSNVVRSAVGLRLVELRKGSVCHHWEFLAESPPTEFAVSVDGLRHLAIENEADIVVVALDSDGAILKRKLVPDQLRTSGP